MYESVEHNQARRALFDEIATQLVRFNVEEEAVVGLALVLAKGFAQRAYVTTGINHAVVRGEYPEYWVCAKYNAIILRDLGFDTVWDVETGPAEGVDNGQREPGPIGEKSGGGQTQPLDSDLVAEDTSCCQL